MTSIPLNNLYKDNAQVEIDDYTNEYSDNNEILLSIPKKPRLPIKKLIKILIILIIFSSFIYLINITNNNNEEDNIKSYWNYYKDKLNSTLPNEYIPNYLKINEVYNNGTNI